jgi:hypothetical protein
MPYLTAIIIICFIIFLLQKRKKGDKLSDKIKLFMENNPDDNVTILAAKIAKSEDFNFIPFNVAEEYCYLINDDKPVDHLDEEYDISINLNRND